MNWGRVEGNWKEYKGKVKHMWRDFTDEELDVIEGTREELVGWLQLKYGYARAQAAEQADTWVKRL